MSRIHPLIHGEDVNDPVKFLQRLATDGGSIVSTGILSSAEIATAFNEGRMFVDHDHLGYVLMPDAQVAFEDWANAKGFCLDQLFMSTEGVPANPYESSDTRLAYEIWCASRGITV